MYNCKVLMYHRVEAASLVSGRFEKVISADDFERQIKYLTERFKVISLDEFLIHVENRQSFKSRCILLTFDDGMASFYDIVFPVLKKYHISATVFLSTAFIGKDKAFWWEELYRYLSETKLENFKFNGQAVNLKNQVQAFQRLASILEGLTLPELSLALDALRSGLKVNTNEGGRSILDWQEIKKMSEDGITFGAHTHNHVNLANMDPEEARNEIALSKTIIEDKLGIAPKVFAYPYGRRDNFNKIHEQILKELGFKVAFTAVWESSLKGKNPMQIGRITISGRDNFNTFKTKVITGSRFKTKLAALTSNAIN
ncbi:MAG: polysaccharide deacetylase family protein [Candidatus Omnitrophota bacterium]|nr:polysaccharide deacetylase family protein [Candidatus Omnitrophota bacterium]